MVSAGHTLTRRRRGIACLACPALICALLAMCLGLSGRACAAETQPVWLLGNDFHTSLVFRTRDVPYWRDISGDPHADELAIGFGASADYRGPSTPLTIFLAIFPNRAALHVVPIRGPVTRRFPHSDVVLLWLKPQSLAKLVCEVNRSFAFKNGNRVFLCRGYYPDSRFYASSEIFYFPYVCSEWVAIKLAHAGVHFFLPRAILSNSLILQAREKGVMLQRHRDPEEHF